MRRLIPITIMILAGACTSSPPAALIPVEPAATSPPNSVISSEPEELLVHVTGHVHNPGLYQLYAGASIADAITAAGGALSGAELSSLNLAQAVGDREQIVVPAPGETIRRGGGGNDQPLQVELNKAEVSELIELPGLGPVLAQRIVDYRDQHGKFGVVEDLLDVSGIGEAKLAELRQYLIVR